VPGRSGTVIATRPSLRTTSQPRRRSTSPMIVTSRMSGTLVRTVVPSASSEAAMSFRTLFFAPLTETSPASRAPPETRKRSIPPV
jgi:hypothetical protein